MIEIKKYKTKDLLSTLHISRATWDRRKSDYLEYFKFFFNYEILEEGRIKYFDIKEQYQEWEPLPRKNLKNYEEMKAFYRQKTHEIVNECPYNSATGISRQILKEDNRYDHKVSYATQAFTRPIVKEDYTKDTQDYIWVKLVDEKYVPLTEEEQQIRKDTYAIAADENKTIEAIIDLFHNEDLTKEEIQDELYELGETTYKRAMSLFKMYTGYYPLKVPKLLEKEGAF